MRFPFAVALTVAAGLAAPAADDKDAKAAFDKMEAGVLKAKSFQTQVEITLVAGKEGVIDVKGRLLVAGGNKLRMELAGKTKGKTTKVAFLSDGTKMRFSDSDQPGRDQDVEKQLTEILLASASRTGFALPLFFAVESSGGEKNKDPFDINKVFAMSDVKLGKKEMIGGIEAQAVSYTLKIKDGKETLTVAVWIDTKTNLPVKRVITGKDGKEEMTVTETYTKTVIDGKIDDKEFALPK